MKKVFDIRDRQRQTPEQIAEQARRWVVRLDGDDATSDDLDELKHWLSESPLHRQEFERIARLWGDIDRLVSDLVFTEHAHSYQPKSAGRVLYHKPWFKPVALAAAFSGMAFFAVLMSASYFPEFGVRFGKTAEFVTESGEVRDVSLPDGSAIKLNTQSKMLVDYQSNARVIDLTGEAFFDVAPNKDKPFMVRAGGYVIRAVGTAFRVYLTKDRQVEVTVTEGTVEIAKLSKHKAVATTDHAPLSPSTSVKLGTLQKGQETVVDDEDQQLDVEDLAAQDIEKKLSWRKGVLVFHQERIEDVIREMNRYSSTQVVIVDPQINDIRVGGYFPANKTQALLATLEESFGIHVEMVNDQLVLLSREPHNP